VVGEPDGASLGSTDGCKVGAGIGAEEGRAVGRGVGMTGAGVTGSKKG